MKPPSLAALALLVSCAAHKPNLQEQAAPAKYAYEEGLDSDGWTQVSSKCLGKNPPTEVELLSVQSAVYRAYENGLGEKRGTGLEVGDSHAPIAPYFNLEGVSKEQYYAYLVAAISSPEDVAQLPDSYISPVSTLASGEENSNSVAWLAKQLLDDLSCKNGQNYNARVIVVPEGDYRFPRTVFTNKEGVLSYFDEKKGITAWEQKNQEKSGLFQELQWLAPFISIYFSIDPTTLEHDYKSLQMHVGYDYVEGFDAGNYFPEGWGHYNEVAVFFKDDAQIIYKKDHSKVVILPQTSLYETEFYRPDGSLKQRDFRNGPVCHEWYWSGTGVVKQQEMCEGTEDEQKFIFYNEQGVKSHAETWSGESVSFY